MYHRGNGDLKYNFLLAVGLRSELICSKCRVKSVQINSCFACFYASATCIFQKLNLLIDWLLLLLYRVDWFNRVIIPSSNCSVTAWQQGGKIPALLWVSIFSYNAAFVLLKFTFSKMTVGHENALVWLLLINTLLRAGEHHVSPSLDLLQTPNQRDCVQITKISKITILPLVQLFSCHHRRIHER